MAEEGLIDQFLQFTGCTNETEAEHYLEACDSNVQAAIELYFSQQAATSSVSQQTSKDPGDIAASSKLNGGPEEDPVRAPLPRTSGVLLDQSYRQSYATPRSGQIATDSVFDGFRDFRAESQAQYDMLTGRGAQNEAQQKRKTLESLFRPPLDLLHAGSWESAREEARSTGRWLLVNVQNVQEFACQALNRDIWNNEAVKELIHSNFILWQIYHDSADGRRFQSYYKVSNYPYLTLIDPRTGEEVTRLQAEDAVCFCDSLMTFLSEHPDFKSWDKKMTAPCSSQNLLPSQNGSCTSVSTERKRKVNDDSASDAGSSKAAKYSEDLDMPDLEKVMGSACSVDKPSASSWENFTGQKGDDIMLLIRFPDGTKEKLKLKDSSKLLALSLFAELHGFPSVKYDLVLNFPKRILSTKWSKSTLKELKMNRQEVIHVEKK